MLHMQGTWDIFCAFLIKVLWIYGPQFQDYDAWNIGNPYCDLRVNMPYLISACIYFAEGAT